MDHSFRDKLHRRRTGTWAFKRVTERSFWSACTAFEHMSFSMSVVSVAGNGVNGFGVYFEPFGNFDG